MFEGFIYIKIDMAIHSEYEEEKVEGKRSEGQHMRVVTLVVEEVGQDRRSRDVIIILPNLDKRCFFVTSPEVATWAHCTTANCVMIAKWRTTTSPNHQEEHGKGKDTQTTD